jgi:hypothetical protein
MKLESVKYYLSKLISDGHKWQYTDINGKVEKPRYYFSSIQWIIIIVSLISSYFLPKGFNNNFIGYIIASLSIFIGLFLTLILTIFDKFQKINFSKKEISEIERVSLIQTKNFFKQFTALTSYSILISLCCIGLLSLSLLSEFFNTNPAEYRFIYDISEIAWSNILTFIYILSILFYRLLVFYFLFDFILILVFSLSSIYNYISLEYERKKIQN